MFSFNEKYNFMNFQLPCKRVVTCKTIKQKELRSFIPAVNCSIFRGKDFFGGQTGWTLQTIVIQIFSTTNFYWLSIKGVTVRWNITVFLISLCLGFRLVNYWI